MSVRPVATVSGGGADREGARAVWQAAVAAVDSTRLVSERLRIDGRTVSVRDGAGNPLFEQTLGSAGRLVVVGAGKAGAGMVLGVERALGGTDLEAGATGWVNVPADCVRPSPLSRIVLHPARPAGLNEPTEAGCRGTERILSLVAGAGPEDLVLVLLSGGGSALLPAPVAGISLADKQRVTRLLSGRGATIHELNTVRKRLSRVKGGGLARAAGGPVVALILSDVIGDPLDIIASGPTVADPSTAADALAILERFDPGGADTPAAVIAELRRQASGERPSAAPFSVPVRNFVIGNNRVACEAALAAARTLGFEARLVAVDQPGEAEAVGRELIRQAETLRRSMSPGQPPICLVSGGEPTVRLAPYDGPRKGGRNQQLALAALVESPSLEGLTLLSGGTDGEDGPTDAAGAVVDRQVADRARTLGLDPRAFLSVNNAYAFFDPTGGLVRTGPTHTNAMDVRVVLIAPPPADPDARD